MFSPGLSSYRAQTPSSPLLGHPGGTTQTLHVDPHSFCPRELELLISSISSNSANAFIQLGARSVMSF